MASGSHTVNGNCADLPTAAPSSNRARTVIRVGLSWAAWPMIYVDGKIAEIDKKQGQGDAEGDIADAGADEGLAAGVGVGLIPVPEADQGIGAEAHAFPAQVNEDQAVRHGDHQHGEDEEVQVTEIADVIGVFPHEGGGIEVDDAGHEGDHHRHDRRQGVEMDVHGGGEPAGPEPLPEGEVMGLIAGQDQADGGGDEGPQDRGAGHGLHRPPGQKATQHGVDYGAA